MKLKIIVKLLEVLLGETDLDGIRGDMYFPTRLLAMSTGLSIAGIACIVAHVFFGFDMGIFFGPLLLILGIFAFLCWKNQKIVIKSEESFLYTSVFGKTREYRFDQIKKVTRNRDSIVLHVGESKIFIDGMMVMSNELVQKINHQLKR